MPPEPAARRLVLYGASFLDALKLVAAINRAAPRWQLMGFLDDTPELRGQSRAGVPVLGGGELLAELAADPGIDLYNNVRGSWPSCQLIAGRIRAVGRDSVGLIHPLVDTAYLDLAPAGVTVADGCVIAAMSSLGDHATLRIGCTVSHDVSIGAFASLGPGVTVGSHVVIEERASIGAGATIVRGVRIGAEAVVGAGSVVNRDVAPGTTVVGVPARRVGTT